MRLIQDVRGDNKKCASGHAIGARAYFNCGKMDKEG